MGCSVLRTFTGHYKVTGAAIYRNGRIVRIGLELVASSVANQNKH